MTLRLFAVRHVISRKLEPDFYASKPAAKKARDLLNTASQPLQFVVTYGPDHRNYVQTS